MTTSEEQNQEIIRRYAEEVWTGGRLDAVEAYVGPGYVRHDPGLPAEVREPEGVRQLAAAYRAAFPDLRLVPEVLFASGDLVAARWLVSATHQGELMGLPATGRTVSITVIELFRLTGGRIVEQWVAIDNLGMLQQLGAIPVLG
jgi:steroid delta-isomerase-like uncharacterized protein